MTPRVLSKLVATTALTLIVPWGCAHDGAQQEVLPSKYSEGQGDDRVSPQELERGKDSTRIAQTPDAPPTGEEGAFNFGGEADPGEDDGFDFDALEPAQSQVEYKKHTVLEFGGDTIDGNISRPDGAYLESRRAMRHQRLIKTRDKFDVFQGTEFDKYPDAPSFDFGSEASSNQPRVAGTRERQALLSSLSVDEELWIITRTSTPDQAIADGEPGCGELRTVIEENGKSREVPLPLEHTDVQARITGYIASVDVKQSYSNPFRSKIEAVYVFPLPQNAAVSDFVMTIGDRKIRGIIREKEEAQEIYRDARAAGHVASLLTQQRPNVFTQRVANIEPDASIDIDITYYNTLPYRDGAYVFTFPMVVGPRYKPGNVGASYLRPEERSAHRLSLSVDLDAGLEVQDLSSVNHEVDVESKGKGRRSIRLAEGSTIPNRDFVLRYEVSTRKTQSALITHKQDGEGYFTLLLQPPEDLKRIRRSPRELIFVLDCSGSMSGEPLLAAKGAIAGAMALLDPDDYFQIIRFSSESSTMGPRPVRATPRNIQRGLLYLSSLESTGGTEMITGLRAALDFPHTEGTLRVVSFMTDGFIGNETDILGAIHEKLGASRIFSFGVGSAPNRYLLERMAKMGRGAVAYVPHNQKAAREAVDAFYERIAYPALADIAIDWGQSRVTDVYPARIPDLHVGRPVVITGRFSGPAPKALHIRGRAGGKRVSYHLDAVAPERGGPELAKIWARMRIADLADRVTYENSIAELAASIEQTALSYGLMSAYTAFVAVDSSQVTKGAQGTTVPVPSPVPRGVRYETAVAR